LPRDKVVKYANGDRETIREAFMPIDVTWNKHSACPTHQSPHNAAAGVVL